MSAKMNAADETMRSNNLISICRSPIHCPVATCHQMIGVTSVLAHFLRDHKQTFDGDFREITADSRALLVFNEQYFRREQTSCLGVLAYAGTGRCFPGVNGLARPNSFLPEKFSCFTNHLPILILGCKTHLSSMFTNKEMTKKLSAANESCNSMEDLLVIWLATMDITRPLHCTISAIKTDLSTSRSSIVRVRNLKSSQIAAEFIPNDTDCLVLNRGELNLLGANDPTGNIQMEVLVHEFKLID